jgi:GT2 family glycosyltransferase
MAQVSILVATYQPRWLDETLASIRAQTFGAYEVLVIDDERSQTTADMVESIGDDRFRYLPTPGRTGPGGAHELGIEMVTSDLIAILNHDDLWSPDFLARAVAALREHPEAVIAFCDHWIIDESGVVDPVASDWASKSFGRDVLGRGVWQPFRRQALLEGAIPLAQAAVFRRRPVSGVSLRVRSPAR